MKNFLLGPTPYFDETFRVVPTLTYFEDSFGTNNNVDKLFVKELQTIPLILKLYI